MAKAKGRFLGRIKVASVAASSLPQDAGKNSINSDSDRAPSLNSVRDVFVPLEHEEGSNPNIEAQSPAPGIFIYRFSEGFNYPNSAHYLDYFTEYIFKQTRRTTLDTYGKLGASCPLSSHSTQNILTKQKDRPWNDPGPRRGQEINLDDNRPILRAIILDFSSVNNVDVSSVQNLIDVRNQLDRYAAPEIVTWHIACVNNRWTKRALASAGFGYSKTTIAQGKWKSVISVADLDTGSTLGGERDVKGARVGDLEIGGGEDTISSSVEKGSRGVARSTKTATILGVVSLLIHFHLPYLSLLGKQKLTHWFHRTGLSFTLMYKVRWKVRWRTRRALLSRPPERYHPLLPSPASVATLLAVFK